MAMDAARERVPPGKAVAATRSPTRLSPLSPENAFLRVQPKLAVSAPDDPFEHEADRVAAAVMRMPAPAVQRKCAACSAGGATCPHCKEEEARVQRKAEGVTGAGEVGSDFASRLRGGAPLDAASRAFFEPRFGHDFSRVRVHTGPEAAATARSINARAFTLGRDVAFAAGEYDPRSERGRGLLAHELVHVVQQSAAPTRIQRSLSVDRAPPTDPQDPLSTMGPAAFSALALSEMGAIVHALCNQFSVDAAGNVVPSATDACDDRDAVAGGSNPIGCCCLCTLTSTSSPWTIHVTGIGGPRTTHSAGTPGGDFFLHPRTSAFEFGAWSAAGGRIIEDPVVAAGHELCGHGALLERGVHPTEAERVDTNVHNPTVKIENLIRAEQGLPGADRGLAADPHRGESFARITIRQFPLNVSSAASLPAAERDKIQLAKDFINANNTWVDIFGHSDLAGPPSAKLTVSQNRADSMQTALTTGTRPVDPAITKTFRRTGPARTGSLTVSGNRFTKVEGRSDFDAIPGAAAADLRRVEIVMPSRPAGAEVPNPGTPTAINPVFPQIGTFLRRRFGGNACDRLLTRSAWA